MTTFTALRRIRLVVIAGAAALVLSGCNFTPYSLPLPGGADLGDNPYTVKAEFRDAMDLVPQGGVRSSDVSVGKITDVSLKPGSWVAVVTMEVNGDTKLPDNTMATIRQTSLLGEKFVSLDAPPQGGVGQLGDGDVIGLDRTGRNPELEEVLSAAALLFNGGGLDKINTITRELNLLLDGRETNLRDLIKNSATFTQILDQNKNAVLGALERINRLALATSEQEDEIDVALRDIPPALEVLDDQRDDLIDMLESLENLGDVATEVIRKSKADTLADLRDLEPVLKGLADAGDSLVGSLRSLITFPFADTLMGDSVARAEAACPSSNPTPADARSGACFGDYINLDMNLELNAQQGAALLSILLNQAGFPGIPLPPIFPAAAAESAAAQTAGGATQKSPAQGLGDAVSGLTGKVVPTPAAKAPAQAEKQPAQAEEKKSGGLLCSILGNCRPAAVSYAIAQQSDVGRLLVGPAVAR